MELPITVKEFLVDFHISRRNPCLDALRHLVGHHSQSDLILDFIECHPL
jgi:hypothetical protein